MKIAPPILGPLEFAGMQNQIILVEHDDDDDSLALLAKVLSGKINIIFSQEDHTMVGFDALHSVVFHVDSVSRIKKVIQLVPEMDYFVINRIDMMDTNFHKRERGSQIKAHLSMLCSPRLLRDANVIITSVNSEYMIREIADKFISLRK